MTTETQAETVAEESEESAAGSVSQRNKDSGRDKSGSTESVPRGVSISMPLSALIAISIAVVMIVVAVVLGGFLWSARSDLARRDAGAADDNHAEQVATRYAVGAASIKFDDLNSWIGQLEAGTSPQLANKFDATAPKLEEILTP